MLKALGDETRFSMYRELASSTRGMSAQELADSLGLHANTVRLHLDRLREAGLVEVEAGAPGHRRPARPRLLARAGRARPRLRPAELHPARRAARRARPNGSAPTATRPTEIGRSWGAEAGKRTRSRSCVKALAGEMSRLGFDPRRQTAAGTTDMAFLHCPFRELAEAYPELVCNLHRGISEGVVDAVGGGSVEEFATLYDRDPCRVTVSVR